MPRTDDPSDFLRRLPDAFHDRYRVVAVLGHGAMGSAYRATQLALGRDVVLKLHRGVGADQRERFLAEARILSRVRHPAVVQLVDFGEDDGIAWLAYLYVPGQTLEQVLKTRGRLPWPEVVSIARSLVAGLVTIHEQGIIHRDIKPANVIVAADPPALFIDFGIARELGTPRLTQEGRYMGTPTNASPEQFTGHEVDARSDLYSMGILLYELLSGEAPFGGPSIEAVLHQQLAIPIEGLPATDPPVPARLEAIVVDLLRKVPEERPASASAVLARLDRVRPGGRSTTGTLRPASARLDRDQRRTRKRRKFLMAAIAGTVAGVLALVLPVWWLAAPGLPPALLAASAAPDRPPPATRLDLTSLPGALLVEWRVDGEAAGARLRVRREGSGELLAEVPVAPGDRTPRALVHPLPEETRCDVELLGPGPSVVARAQAMTGPASGAAVGLAKALDDMGALEMLARLHEEAGPGSPIGSGPPAEVAPTPGSGPAGEPESVILHRWRDHARRRMAAVALDRWLKLFGHGCDRWFGDPVVGPADRFRMVWALQDLECLVASLAGRGVELRPDPFPIRSEAYGPVERLLDAPAGAVGVVFGGYPPDRASGHLESPDPLVLESRLDGPLVLVDWDRVHPILGRSRELRTVAGRMRLRYEHPEPLPLSRDRARRALDVMIRTRHMGPARRLVVELAADAGPFRDAASFVMAPPEAHGRQVFRADPRLLGGDSTRFAIRLETHADGLDTPVRLHFIGFRYH